MYHLYGKINRGHRICPPLGGCPLFRGAAIRGFTIYNHVSVIPYHALLAVAYTATIVFTGKLLAIEGPWVIIG